MSLHCGIVSIVSSFHGGGGGGEIGWMGVWGVEKAVNNTENHTGQNIYQ